MYVIIFAVSNNRPIPARIIPTMKKYVSLIALYLQSGDDIKYFDLSANFDFPLFVISGIPDAVINLPVHFIFKFGRIRITVGTIAVDICGFFDTGYSADGFAGTSLFFRIPDTIINAPKPINPAAIKMLLNVIKITPLYYAVIVFNTETVYLFLSILSYHHYTKNHL